MTETVLITEVFPPRRGGSGRWFDELYRRFPPGSVAIAAGEAEGQEAFDARHPQWIRRVPLEFASWGAAGVRRYCAAYRRLVRLVRDTRPTALHCGKCLPEGLLGVALSRRFSLPLTCFVHGEELTLARTSRELRWLTGRVLRAADRVIANSDHSRRLLAGDWGVPDGRITVLHPGVDTSFFVPGDRDEAVRRRLGWSGRRVVLTVGALQKRKGQDMLIRALPRIRDLIPDVLYAVVGEGWERDALERLAAATGVADHVQFRGVSGDDDLLACYQQCDLFALPNRRVGWDFEGFGIVLLEAQACGVPVLAGTSGGTVEAVCPDTTSRVVDCESPEPLARAIAEMLAGSEPDTPPLDASGARDWVRGRFDWAVAVDAAREHFGTETRKLTRPPTRAAATGDFRPAGAGS